MTVNKFGLKRSDLTEAQRREIRQRSGFGCVVCGYAIGDYEHIDPKFANATEHNVNNMTFLCTHCHGLSSRGRLSTQTIKRHMASPAALKSGFSFDQFDIGSELPIVIIGPIEARNSKIILEYLGTPVLYFREPEIDGGPFRLNAIMTDKIGNTIFQIVDNEWRARTSNWDVVSVGPRTTIRNGPRDIALVIVTIPPHTIKIERMNLSVNGSIFRADEHSFRMEHQGSQIRASAAIITGSVVALSFEKDGLALGKGGGSVELRNVGIGASVEPPMNFKRYYDPKVYLQPPTVTGSLWEMVQVIRAATGEKDG